ncbi:prolipoprotein diacylglyceryl transferase family protein [Niabella yanshanensis]|uniref:Prolipoprotein diacylglyceryl transferase family protein n=1 Tax=Niabella yanshanensis TaxID=577386 RepID=A0ABZ0WB01_9BACT|nr:prolipoprotein diacylglyceryl transferase family protein [Niabella yanshanensis]WQD40336.1 prolipoprotein diacylglyceryl transferase family protein [Niabella yanshanensis]
MYPNLYYVFRDWFGVEWKFLHFVNSFGFFVAIGFIVCSVVLAKELRRKSKEGIFQPTEETITVGHPASISELATNFLLGFLLGYKILGLAFLKNSLTVNPQDYIFSSQGNWLAGLALGAVFAAMKWREKNKQKLAKPETRTIRVWPHDRVGEITMIALIFGLVGAKIFDTFENWDSFIKDPSSIFSASGLTFYGGLILAGIALWWFTRKHKIPFIHFVDVMGPVMMLAYGLGRIGCQVSGDGDWGIYNAAFKTTPNGGILPAAQGDFEAAVNANAEFFARHDTHHTFFSKPGFLSFLPDWFFAYDFPHNVNETGVRLANCADLQYCNHLPVPVFPTSLYEIIMCLILFGILWMLRKKIKVPGLLFGIYLVFNGLERFMIERIRVNVKMHFLGIEMTQAQLISFAIILGGIAMIIFARTNYKKSQPTTV